MLGIIRKSCPPPLLAIGALLLAGAMAFTEPIRKIILDPELRLMQRIARPQAAGPGQVIVLGIDDEDMKLIGYPPIHRKNYAMIVDFLKKQGAKTVVFDLFLDEAAEGDEELRDSLEAFGQYVLAEKTEHDLTPPGTYPAMCSASSLDEGGLYSKERFGFVNSYSRDPLVALPLLAETPAGIKPGLALLACVTHWNLKLDKVMAVDPGRLRLSLPGGRTIVAPMYGKAEILLRFQPPASFRFLPVRRIISAIKNDEKIAWIEGSLVLVGICAQNQDLVTSVYGEQLYGVTAMATAARQMLEADFYQPMNPIHLALCFVGLLFLLNGCRFLPAFRWKGLVFAAVVVAAIVLVSAWTLARVPSSPALREASWTGLVFSELGFVWLSRRAYLVLVPRMNGADFAARVLHQRRRVRDLLDLAGGRETDWLEIKGMTEPSCDNEEDKNRERPRLHWEISKAVIALANTRGGVIVIGLDDKAPHETLDLAKYSDPGRLLEHNDRDGYWMSYLQKIFCRQNWDYPEPQGRRRVHLAVHRSEYPPHFEWGFFQDGEKTVFAMFVHPVPVGSEIIVQEGNAYKLFCRIEGDVGGTKAMASPEEIELWRKRRNPISRKFNGLLSMYEKNLLG